MKLHHIALPMLVGLLLAVSPQHASAQLGRFIRQQVERQLDVHIGPQHMPGYHIDHEDHIIRDSHGHIIGRYHRDVVHRNSMYIVPHTAHSAHHGTYFLNRGAFYFAPQTASGGRHEPTRVRFGGFAHVEDLAMRLDTLSNEFCLDLHYNYSHNGGFKETYKEAYQIRQVAQYIHDAEHNHDRDAIRAELDGLDKLFHHVQDDLKGWTEHPRRRIGEFGLASKVDMLESTLHNLMNDVGVHPSPTEQAPPPNAGLEQAPPPSDEPEQAPAPQD